MLIGYAIIAVPTGIVTSELTLANSKSRKKQEKACKNCNSRGLDLMQYFVNSEVKGFDYFKRFILVIKSQTPIPKVTEIFKECFVPNCGISIT